VFGSTNPFEQSAVSLLHGNITWPLWKTQNLSPKDIAGSDIMKLNASLSTTVTADCGGSRGFT